MLTRIGMFLLLAVVCASVAYGQERPGYWPVLAACAVIALVSIAFDVNRIANKIEKR